MAKKGPRPKLTATRTKAEPPPDNMEMVLHTKQIEFTESNAIYRGFVSGVGGGKSWVGAFDLLSKAEPGALYAIIAPTYKVLSDATMRTFIELAKKFGLWSENKYRKTDNVAMLNNGVEILFRSGDNPGNLRGPTLRGCWMDECSQMKEDVFGVMIGRLRHGGEQGWLTGTFTPAGKEHWTYRVFGDTNNPNVKLVQCSTRDNPFLSTDFYQNLAIQYGKGEGGLLRARQELEGEFLCVEGAEWGPEFFGPQIWFDEFPHDDQAIRVVALDSSKGIGGKTGDYSSFCLCQFSHSLLWMDFDLDNVRDSSTMAQTAVEIQKRFKPHYFGLETEFGGSVLVDDIENVADKQNVLMPLVLVPTQGVNKDVRIRRLTPYLSRGMIRFRNSPGSKIAITQFEVFPHGQHEDACDSAEMAVRLINESGMV